VSVPVYVGDRDDGHLEFEVHDVGSSPGPAARSYARAWRRPFAPVGDPGRDQLHRRPGGRVGAASTSL